MPPTTISRMRAILNISWSGSEGSRVEGQGSSLDGRQWGGQESEVGSRKSEVGSQEYAPQSRLPDF